MSGPEGYPYRDYPFGEDRDRLDEETHTWTEWEPAADTETRLSSEEIDITEDHIEY